MCIRGGMAIKVQHDSERLGHKIHMGNFPQAWHAGNVYGVIQYASAGAHSDLILTVRHCPYYDSEVTLKVKLARGATSTMSA